MQTSRPPDGAIGEGFDEYLFYLLTQVANRRSRDFAPALEEIGLSLAEWRAMSVINRLGGCLMSELSEFTTVDRTTLTRTVDQLVRRALVSRNVSAGDRRKVVVALTDQGEACFASAVEVLKTYNKGALEGLSATDMRMLRAPLQRILMNIVRNPEQCRKVLNFER